MADESCARTDVTHSDFLDLSYSIDDEAVVELPVDALGLDWSVRTGEASAEYLRTLAELEEELPPIVVQHPSMRVIDGVHRVRVAMMLGRRVIPARLFRGSDDDAFVLAVRLNITHGLALTRADRNAAAVRIVRSHPQWSNRMVAKVAGLSAGTVAGIRRRSTDQLERSNTRVGLDGRSRPLNGAARRQLVGELLAQNPDASIRAIAGEAGVSPSTVHSLRRQMTEAEPRAGGSNISSLTDRTASTEAGINVNDTISLVARDPSLRLTETGRRMIRLLNRSSADSSECDTLISRIPEHCVGTAATLARHFANKWAVIAEGLERRHRLQTS